jgi:hypothetical protein
MEPPASITLLTGVGGLRLMCSGGVFRAVLGTPVPPWRFHDARVPPGGGVAIVSGFNSWKRASYPREKPDEKRPVSGP